MLNKKLRYPSEAEPEVETPGDADYPLEAHSVVNTTETTHFLISCPYMCCLKFPTWDN